MEAGSSLSSPVRRVKDGIETAVFGLSYDALDAIKRAGEISEYQLNRTLAGWYTLDPRPAPNEIIWKKIEPMENGTLRLTLKIARGHYVLAEVFRNLSEGFHVAAERREGYVRLIGSMPLPIEAFPSSDFSWVKANSITGGNGE